MTYIWASRELPVLEAAVELADEKIPRSLYPSGREIAARAGLEMDTVAAALVALDGEFIGLRKSIGEASSWMVLGVTPAARRAVGQWPTAEDLIEQLAAGIAQAAERETEPQRKSRLLAIADGLGSFARDVAVGVVAQMTGGVIPHI